MSIGPVDRRKIREMTRENLNRHAIYLHQRVEMLEARLDSVTNKGGPAFKSSSPMVSGGPAFKPEPPIDPKDL